MYLSSCIYMYMVNVKILNKIVYNHCTNKCIDCNGHILPFNTPNRILNKKFKYTKGVIKNGKSKDRQWYDQRTDNDMTKRKKTKGQTMIYNILHRKLKIAQPETH